MERTTNRKRLRPVITLREKIEQEIAELEETALRTHFLMHQMPNNARTLQNKADALKWVIKLMDSKAVPRLEVECLVKGGVR